MLGDSARGARPGAKDVSAAVPHLMDPTFPRPPPRPQPRPGAPGLSARRWLQSASRALLRRPGRGWHGASAGLAGGAGRSQRGGDPGCARRSSRVLLGAPFAARSAPGPRPLAASGARRGYTFPSPPALVSSCAARSRDFLSGKLRGSFPGLLAPPQVSAPSSSLGSRCSPAARRRRRQPGPGGGRGPRRRRLPTRPAM